MKILNDSHMPKYLKGLSVVALVVVLALVIHRVQKNASIDSQPSTLKIGVLLPLTGKFVSLGEDTKNGLDMAKQDLEKRFGKKLEIVYEDNMADPKAALLGANKLLDVDHVPLVIGGPGSSANLAVAPVMTDRKVIFVAVSLTPKLNDAGEFIFKALPDINGEAERMASYIFKKGIRQVGILYDSTSDTLTTGRTIFSQTFEKLGGKIVGAEGFNPSGLTDVRTQLTQLKAKEAQVLYLMATEKPAGIILKQAQELNWSVPIFGWSVFDSDELFKGAGTLSEGVVITGAPFSCNDAQSEKMKLYCQDYKKRYGQAPNYFGARSYDVLQVIVTAVLNVSSQSLNSPEGKEAVMKVLSQSLPDGVSGEVKFDATGSVRDENFVFRIVKDGKFVRLEQ